MKFFIIVIIATFFAFGLAELRNLQAQNCRYTNSSGKCIECIFRYVMINGVCRAVSDQCKTWSQTTALCLSCYGGYTLQNGACVIGGGTTEEPSGNPCSSNQIEINDICVNVNDLLNILHYLTGTCASCLPGHTLRNGRCTL